MQSKMNPDLVVAESGWVARFTSQQTLLDSARFEIVELLYMCMSFSAAVPIGTAVPVHTSYADH